MPDCETNGHIWDGRVGGDFSCEKCGAPYQAPARFTRPRLMPRADAKLIADCACDLADKALYWKQRALAAEAALTQAPAPVDQVGVLREALEVLEFYANPRIYEAHPHGPAFDRRDMSFSARAFLDKLSALTGVSDILGEGRG